MCFRGSVVGDDGGAGGDAGCREFSAMTDKARLRSSVCAGFSGAIYIITNRAEYMETFYRATLR